MTYCALMVLSHAEEINDPALKKALEKIERKQYQDAQSIIEKLPEELRKKNTVALRLMGRIAFETNDLPKADQLFGKAYELGEQGVLVSLSLVKVKTQNAKWLQENKEILAKHIKTDSDMVAVFAMWSIAAEDMTLLERGLKEISNEDLVKNPRSTSWVLQARRYFFSGNTQSRESIQSEKQVMTREKGTL